VISVVRKVITVVLHRCFASAGRYGRLRRVVVLLAGFAALAAPAPALGTGWTAPTSIDGKLDLTSVSCSSASFCAAVDSCPGCAAGTGGNALTFNGSSWSAPDSIDAQGEGFTSVSCPVASFFAAVDFDGNALTYNGTSWSAPDSIDPPSDTPGSLTSVSCASASFCVAVDGAGNVFTYNGSAWSAPDNIDTVDDAALSGVSCPSASFCVPVDQLGDVFTYNGSSWSSPDSIYSSGGLMSVSCPSASFCAAVGGTLVGGSALTYDGSSWSAPHTFISPPLVSVSCASASFCLAADAHGEELTYNDNSWSAARTINARGGGFSSVSCPSVSFCAAVGPLGDALTYSGNGAGNGVAGSGGTGVPAVGRARVSGPIASVNVSCHGRAGTTCKIALVISVRETVRAGRVIGATARTRATKKTVVLATVSVTLTAGHTKSRKIRLNSTGRRLLARLHTLKAALVATASGETIATQAITYTTGSTQRMVRLIPHSSTEDASAVTAKAWIVGRLRFRWPQLDLPSLWRATR
jgi:hypothetical protein